jgi:hypothetical protein
VPCAGIVDRQTEGFQTKDKDSDRTGFRLNFSLSLFYAVSYILIYIAINYIACRKSSCYGYLSLCVCVVKVQDFTKHIGIAVTVWNRIRYVPVSNIGCLR